MKIDLIEINKWTRPGKTYKKNKIVIHWVGNPGTTAAGNAGWMRNIHRNPDPKHVSWHYTIGLDGEIEKTLTEDELGYHASSWRYNKSSIGIECCHPDDSGEFTRATYDALVGLVRDIMIRKKIKKVLRHYDCPRTPRKVCPKWFVDHPDAWYQFLNDIQIYRNL